MQYYVRKLKSRPMSAASMMYENLIVIRSERVAPMMVE